MTFNYMYQRYLSDDTTCHCGFPLEDPGHFFRACPKYDAIRNDIFGNNLPPTKALLYGYDSVSTNTNVDLFSKVHKFIERSGRF